MICKQCGCEILDDSQFCENCGTKVEREAAPASAAAPSAAPAGQPAAAPAVPAAPVAPAAPAASPVAPAAPAASPEFQAIPVTPVYASNSIYAQNAANAYQQAQYVPVQQYAPVQQPYAPAVPVPQYQAPAYMQQYPVQMGTVPDKRNVFSRILMIVSITTTVIYALILLVMLLGGVSSSRSASIFGLLAVSGFSVFVLVFSITKKNMGKGSFIGLLIPLCVVSYLVFSLIGEL